MDTSSPDRYVVPEPASILVVCEANICRSPYVEAVMRESFAFAGLEARFAVRSAGLSAIDGAPMCGLAQQLLADQGAATDGLGAHVSRALDVELIAGADLILVAELDHRARINRTLPGVQSKVFTLLEIAHLAGVDSETAMTTSEDDTFSNLVARLNFYRGLVPLDAAPRTWMDRARRGRRNRDPFSVIDGHTSSARDHSAIFPVLFAAATRFSEHAARHLAL
ncbi:hypothetical protein [Marisediminicola sp. LYQ134]|uniref:arsenate reductase/protein-tyrosine-phosphatase family protein n=1 Tax=Marisediminicola sp. LYQ134 TaxID=3391061 RepID=UPI003983179D